MASKQQKLEFKIKGFPCQSGPMLIYSEILDNFHLASHDSSFLEATSGRHWGHEKETVHIYDQQLKVLD
jgi:hypothetical protein